MKKLTVIAILLIGLAANASSFFGGDIPSGDKLRTSGSVSVRSATDTTLLNLASQGGTLHTIMLGTNSGNSSTVLLNNIKVTVDGASERTLSFGMYVQEVDSAVGHKVAVVIPTPLIYTSSLVVKINYTVTSGANGTALVMYSKK